MRSIIAGAQEWGDEVTMRVQILMASLGVAVGVSLGAQAPVTNRATIFEGERLIIGDTSPVIESGAILVQDGQIRAVGPKGRVQAPSGATRVDLTGKTVMPALVNVHVHMGYEGYTTFGAANHTPANVVDHLQRSAFYEIGRAHV